MKAAAENLASVTLELGGKSPSIITDSASLKDAAQRTAVAKFVNNGQTCVAPDYVLVDEKIVDRFTTLLTDQIKKLFTENNTSFAQSEHYCRIINDKHFVRLNELLNETLEQGARVLFGGEIDRGTRFIHPTILTHVPHSSRIMSEEIFGPILPIITYNKLDEAIAFVNAETQTTCPLHFFRKEKGTGTNFTRNERRRSLYQRLRHPFFTSQPSLWRCE